MYEYKGIVERVVDGDTLLVNVDLGFDVWVKTRFRLARINTPEITGVDKAEGLKAKDFVIGLCNNYNNDVRILSKGKDKYGRYIAEVSLVSNDGTSVNISDLMLERGYAAYIK